MPAEENRRKSAGQSPTDLRRIWFRERLTPETEHSVTDKVLIGPSNHTSPPFFVLGPRTSLRWVGTLPSPFCSTTALKQGITLGLKGNIGLEPMTAVYS
jgi:hypothetical protein